MANNYYQATVSPELPATLFSEAELETLEYACGLSSYRNGDDLYFYAEECFREDGEDQDDNPIDCLALMQEKLRQLDPAAYPHITIQGAATCSKMRADEFGGFAHLVTRDAVRTISTWQWIHEQTHLDAGPHAAAGTMPAPLGDPPARHPYSVLLLYPDYAGDYGTETFYALVEATDAIDAVAVAQREASAAQQGIDIEPGDFAPLLVTAGHHASEPLFNK